MKTYRIAVLILAALPLGAQTAGELLQKGIYDQETAGDLDAAISIYHQIVNSGSSPRDVAAQAQYRLAQSLFQKGDLPNGAQEFSNLARNYADYGKLVSSLATQARGNTSFFIDYAGSTAEKLAMADRLKALAATGVADPASADGIRALEAQARALKEQAAEAERAGGGGQTTDQSARATAMLAEVQSKLIALRAVETSRFAAANGMGRGGRGMGPGVGGGGAAGIGGGILSPLASLTFDPASPIIVTGAAVFKLEWQNPNATVSVDPKDGTGKRYTFLMASPNQLLKQGMTRISLKPGDEVTVTGVLSTGGQILPDGTIAASAATITRADGTKLFDRAALPASSNTCNWVSATVPPPCPAAPPQ